MRVTLYRVDVVLLQNEIVIDSSFFIIIILVNVSNLSYHALKFSKKFHFFSEAFTLFLPLLRALPLGFHTVIRSSQCKRAFWRVLQSVAHL